MTSDRVLGTVKWFDAAKGFGFITAPSLEADVFVHYKNLQGDGFRSLKEGQSVEFTLSKTDRGFQAEDVSVPAQ